MPAKDGVSKYANKRTDFNKVSAMTLSADTLNQRSPYELMQLGELTFRFVTDQQIHYTVGFYKDTIFMDDGAYHFFIDNSEHEHGSYDSKILEVVTVILEEFFSQEPTVMLYICDSTDKRQAARDRLYHLWFYDYARSHEMTLFSDSVSFKSVNYYAGILMRHDHPLHDMILSYYQDFLKHVPQLYAPRDK